MAKPVTIRDVARKAGVALGTVSRVLNRTPGVDAALSERVRTAARALKYRPLRKRGERRTSGSESERALHRSIGVLLLGMDATLTHLPVVTSALQGIEAHAAGADVSVMLAEAPALDRIPPFLARSQVDGLIVKVAGQGDLPPANAHPLLGRIMSLPRVWVLGRPAGWAGDHCGPDDEAVGRMAAEHLVERGHRKLGWLNPKGGHFLFRQRGSAFRLRAGELGARVMDFESEDAGRWKWPLKPVLGLDELAPLLDRWKSQPANARPTALFVPADSIAVQLYAWARTAGVQVGTDLSVISCNGEMTLLGGLHPRPTTVDVRAESIGRRAAEQLLARTRQPFDWDDADIRIAPRLLEGSSVKPIGG